MIFNRVNNPDKWADTISGVINSPGQFSTNKPNITESTKLACEYAFLFPDTTNGAEFFNKAGPNNEANKNLEFVFEDDIGHNFYKSRNNKLLTDNNIDTTDITDDSDSVG